MTRSKKWNEAEDNNLVLNVPACLRWANQRHEGRCVVTGCDVLQEWMLPWWYSNLRQHSPLPVVFVDKGLSRKGRAWCQERGEVVRNPIPVADVLLVKPLGLIQSPYAVSLWLDVDCEILKPLEPIFDETHAEIGVVRDVPGAYDPIQGGVVVVRHGSAMVLEWAGLCRDWKRLDHRKIPSRYYDQSMLAHLWRQHPEAFTLLREEWNWVRQRGASPTAAIIHWWGKVGKEEIRSRIASRPRDDPWRALKEGPFSFIRHGKTWMRRKLFRFRIRTGCPG